MKNLAILTILILLSHCEPVPSQSTNTSKKLVLDNYNYEDVVGMVQLLPVENGRISELENPVIFLNDRNPLILRFDLLTDQFEYLAARIIHCNKDWKKSLLRDMEFLGDINNYRITDYDYSLNTSQPYINYRFNVPTPTLSGNYILAIHRRGNPSDVLFTRKFLVVNNTSQINQQVRISTTVSKRESNQQVDFDVNYGNIQVNNPTRDVSIVILQNHRWQDAITNLQPNLIRPNENYMEFRLLNLSTNFFGWNEFRFFDMRTLDVTGRNVANIESSISGVQVTLPLDASRGKLPYTQNLRDINGNFILQTTDAGEVPLNADYASVRFRLKSPKRSGKVYVIGRFNNWALSAENLMTYDDRSGYYSKAIQLKQGYYDYLYLVDEPGVEPYILEGSHLLTENDYEILVYYRKPGNVNDELIGYKRFSSIDS